MAELAEMFRRHKDVAVLAVAITPDGIDTLCAGAATFTSPLFGECAAIGSGRMDLVRRVEEFQKSSEGLEVYPPAKRAAVLSHFIDSVCIAQEHWASFALGGMH